MRFSGDSKISPRERGLAGGFRHGEASGSLGATVCIGSSKVDFKNAASQNLEELRHIFQFKAELGKGVLNNSKAKHGPESRKVLIMLSLRK
jgi:hypothetical protein